VLLLVQALLIAPRFAKYILAPFFPAAETPAAPTGDDGYAYTTDLYDVQPRSIVIEWGAGSVEIVRTDGSSIELTERSYSPLESDDRLITNAANSAMEIRSSKEKDLADQPEKFLTLALPEELCGALDTLTVITYSAGVSFRDLSGGVCAAATISGSLDLAGQFDTWQVETISGSAVLTAPNGKMRVSTVSGNVSLREIDRESSVNTKSGSVSIRTPMEDFTLTFDTVSGQLTEAGLFGTKEYRTYIYGSGGTALTVTTNSGDLTLAKD